MTTPGFSVIVTDWQRDAARLKAVRAAVFVREQGIPATLEWDAHDAEAIHVLALDDADEPTGTGRLLADGRIGRMAVLPGYRGRGIGSALLARLVQLARERGRAPWLSAQTSACDFYVKRGFVAVGETFTAAGIPHQRMHWGPPHGAPPRTMITGSPYTTGPGRYPKAASCLAPQTVTS
jgi:predicted GNAT family N-acyltransferase